MAENIVNTYNLYIDTSRGHSADSQGDNFNLNLGHAGIVAISRNGNPSEADHKCIIL